MFASSRRQSESCKALLCLLLLQHRVCGQELTGGSSSQVSRSGLDGSQLITIHWSSIWWRESHISPLVAGAGAEGIAGADAEGDTNAGASAEGNAGADSSTITLAAGAAGVANGGVDAST